MTAGYVFLASICIAWVFIALWLFWPYLRRSNRRDCWRWDKPTGRQETEKKKWH